MRKFKQGKFNKNKKRRHRAMILLSFTVIIASAALTVYAVDARVMPAVLKISQMNMQAELNAVSASAIEAFARDRGLKSDDFYMRTEDNEGRTRSLSVNAVLVNELCAYLGERASERLNALSEERISIPMGVLLGINFLANRGPAWKVALMPRGAAMVDYESSFTQAGINQVNFQVWISLSAVVEVVNPLSNESININRKIMLVNTLITGEIPGTYLELPGK